jgi:alpha-L-fucosidase
MMNESMDEELLQQQMDIEEAHAGLPVASPSEEQRAWQKLGFGLMFSFGVNTFSNVEWSDGSLPAATFAPSDLQTDEWCLAAKAAGANYVMPTTKHMDGFCLWPTATTDYSVASAPGGVDVLAELRRSADSHGLGLALYFSLWDLHRRSDSDRDYAAFAKRQLGELLTSYGPIVELWFDGAWSKGGVDFPDGERWQWREIYELVKAIQPNCQVGVNPTTHHPGQIVLWPVDFRVGEKSSPRSRAVSAGDSSAEDFHGELSDDRTTFYCDDRPVYLPWEGVYTLSQGGSRKGLFTDGKWFWHHDDSTCHEPQWVVETLQGLNESSGNMLLNLPIDNRGRVRECDMKCLQEVGALRSHS